MNEAATAALREKCDAVVMLTASDWHTEPRSNRYHYATRFARVLPVIFVQPDWPGLGFRFEESGHVGITLLHVGSRYTAEQAQTIALALVQRGIRRPLLWAYRGDYHQVLRFVYSPLRVFHATEDYYVDEFTTRLSPKFYADLEYYVAQVDLVVAVSQGVRASYVKHCAAANVLVLENGCDDAFWKQFRRAAGSRTEGRENKVAFYQGGINSRLDYALIRDMAAALPDWQFWFCGARDTADKDWKALAGLANMCDLGALAPEQVAVAAGQADVGIIPFIQTPFITEVSLPLKAFEYVASDLPVVSVPIRALEPWPELFTFATGAADFAAAIRRVAPLRDDPAAQARRATVAALQDYDRRFDELLTALNASRAVAATCYKILVIYDAESDADESLRRMLADLGNHSQHTVSFLVMPADQALHCDLSMFDVVLVHDDPQLAALPEATAQALVASGAYRMLLSDAATGDAARMARKLAQSAGHAVALRMTDAATVPAWRFPGVAVVPLAVDQPTAIAAQLDAFLAAHLRKAKPYILVQEVRAVLQHTTNDPAALEVLRPFPLSLPAFNRLVTTLPVAPRAVVRCMASPFELYPGTADNVLASLNGSMLIRALLLRWFRVTLHLLPLVVRKALLRVLRPLAGWLRLL